MIVFIFKAFLKLADFIGDFNSDLHLIFRRSLPFPFDWQLSDVIFCEEKLTKYFGIFKNSFRRLKTFLTSTTYDVT